MNLVLTPEQKMIAETARDFAARELAPSAAKRDRTGEFPEAELRALAELGLMGINISSEDGGAGAGVVAYVCALEELAYADPSVAVTVSVTNMVAELIESAGTKTQRQHWLPGLFNGNALCGAFGLSEAHAGSDVSAISTSAKRCPRGWIINGTKQWISHGDRAGVLLVWAVTDAAQSHRALSCFIVPGTAQGLEVVGLEKKMGLRGSSTAQLAFDNVEVPDDALLGSLGEGFLLAMRALNGGRIGVAAQALGTARCAFDAAVKYSREREAFGRPLHKHQAIGNMLADMATAIEASRLLILRAAYLKEQGQPFVKQAAMAKLFATEKACHVCDLAIQIHGGAGYTQDFPVERCYRDARVSRIYEGTSEIQRLVIARQLLKEAA